jgi:hypothetical protein
MAPFAYGRFHGSEALHTDGCTDEMPEAWAARQRDLAREVDELFVYSNNDAEGFAIANARRFSELLDVGGAHLREARRQPRPGQGTGVWRFRARSDINVVEAVKLACREEGPPRYET